ncbi:fanconi anemia group J protein [Tanacetum coccineum]
MSSSSSKPRKPTVIPIEFPFQPYGSQLSFMSRVIATLDRAQRETKNHKAKLTALLYGGKADPEAMADVFGRGGGFVPEAEPSGIIELGQLRTHSQISQVIGEFRKTNYHVPMAVLGSRKRYCTNADVRGQDNIDEKWNAPMIRAHPSVRGGCNEVRDIEDLVKLNGTRWFGVITFHAYLLVLRSGREPSLGAIRIAADADPDIDHLSGMASTVIEGLFSSLTYFFFWNWENHVCDYQLPCNVRPPNVSGLQLVLQGQTIKSEAVVRYLNKPLSFKRFAGEESPVLQLCGVLNPISVFKNMADTCLSVILTSG